MEIEKAIDDAGQEMMELSHDGSVIARIYAHPEGIRIVSDYLTRAAVDATRQAIVVTFTDA